VEHDHLLPDWRVHDVAGDPVSADERVVRVLAEHEYALGLKRGSICACGFVPTVDAATLATQQDYHRAHVAAALAPVLAEVRAETLRPLEELFSGGPDTVCRTIWREAGGGWPDEECVVVPMADLRDAFRAAAIGGTA
jgi:hypothetical protein